MADILEGGKPTASEASANGSMDEIPLVDTAAPAADAVNGRRTSEVVDVAPESKPAALPEPPYRQQSPGSPMSPKDSASLAIPAEKYPPWNKLEKESSIFTVLLIGVQLLFFGYAAVDNMDYGHMDMTSTSYTMFIHVSIMIFFGFGFLMTFLRRGGHGAVGNCLIVSAVVVELSLVMAGILKEWQFAWGGALNIETLINGLFCAGAVMISMGAVLGKVSPSQLLLMGIMETPIYWVNMGIYFGEIEGHDAAGGVLIHTFGAYFGLACAFVISRPENLDHDDNASIYSSDLFSLLGTLFLWLFWPSFCAAVAGDSKAMFLAITNTYISLIGSTVGFAAVTRFLHGWKLNMVELQNATLAGGVAVGVPANYELGPAGALLLGFLAGIISTFGYAKLDLGKYIKLSDTCGVNNLHGMPGLLSAFAGIACYKAGDQALGLGVALALAIGGGLLTGVCMRLLPAGASTIEEYFNDAAYFEVPDDYELPKEMRAEKEAGSAITAEPQPQAQAWA